MNNPESFEEWLRYNTESGKLGNSEFLMNRSLMQKIWNHQNSKIDIAIGMMQIALDQKEAAERSLALAEKVVEAARDAKCYMVGDNDKIMKAIADYDAAKKDSHD